MATGHTNTNKQVLSKLNEVLSSQETTNDKVTEVDNGITRINSSLPSITNSVNTINSTLSPIANTINTINSRTSQLSTIVNQIKLSTDQPKFRQYIPNTSMRFCGLDTRYVSHPTIIGCSAMYNGELHVVSGDHHVKWTPSTGWVILSEKSVYGYYWVSGACMIVYNGELHLLGGSADQIGYNHMKWDGSTWSRVSTLPFHFSYGQAVIYNNELHILGSYNGDYSDRHYRWNGSVWTSVSTLPTGFCECSAVVYNDEIHLLGNGASNSKGYKYSQYTHYKWSYSIGWKYESDLPIYLSGGGAVSTDGTILITGGRCRNDTENKNHDIYAWNGDDWTYVGIIPIDFDNDIMLVYDGIIHILGDDGSTNVHYQLRPLYKTTMYLKNNTFVTGNQLSIKGINDATYLVQFGSSYRIQYDGVYDISASSGIMLT